MTVVLSACLLFLQSLSPEAIEHAHAGTEALAAGRIEQAIQEFRSVTQLQPALASGYANLGEAYFQAGNYGLAIPALERALTLNGNLMGTHQTLGVALLVRGDAAAALSHLEKTGNPALLGLAYLETGKLGAAIMALSAALERQPDDPDLLYYYGTATAAAASRTAGQLGHGFTPKADTEGDVMSLQKALAGEPNDPQLLARFSNAATFASRRAFDRIIEKHPDAARAHQVSAERALKSGRVADAHAEYVEALRLASYTSGVHLAFGRVLAAQGDWQHATLEFQAETKLRPASPDAHFALAALYRQVGKTTEADREMKAYQALLNHGDQ